MKKRIIKITKGFFLFLVLVLTVLITGILWPTSTVDIPKSYATILIKSVNIIDVKTGEVSKNRDVLIEKNRIKAIDTAGVIKVNEVAFIINSKGKYMIPGLWDMHTHSNQHSPWLHHPLYIASGVTGIRDMSGTLDKEDSYWVGSKERIQWNNDLKAGSRVTPRYVLQSSYQIDGRSSVPDGSPNFFKLEKEQDVGELLAFYKKEHVDFIKVYQQIKPESYRKLATEAPKYGMHLAGHKPMFLGLDEAIHLGQKSFEHGRIFMFESFSGADSLREPNSWRKFFSKSKKAMITDYNADIALGLMELMQAKNAHWTPTLQTLKFEANAHDKQFLDNPNLKYTTQIRKKLWWGIDASNNKKRNESLDGKGVSLDFYEAVKNQVKLASKIGVPIMTGTDVTDSYTFAGFSLHNELKELTECGLTNLEALQAATIVPAHYTKLESKYGSVEINKIADLIILDKNPLAHIENTKLIDAVLMNGMYYDAEKLEELKVFTASVASSFHMNVKALYSLVNSPLIRTQFAD